MRLRSASLLHLHLFPCSPVHLFTCCFSYLSVRGGGRTVS
ncbi:hypothetical protein E2C01_085361 [Portunus trituberculatus]|uniref:Uncharacterized protein n=1 Tax=Portunus trituberculatus TaxID=210409 RepID=A0A5B7J0S5_PORTR|nr:hypothetical protein [Portunus trituberculatus]